MKNMAKITYENKVALNVNSDIADVNKCNATDLNEIKEVVNTNDDNTTTNSNAIGNLSSLNTTSKSNLVGAVNEVNTNDIAKGTYSTNEVSIGKWTNNKSIYRKVITFKALPENTIKTIDCNIDNCDNIWIENQFVVSDSKYVCMLPMPGYGSTVGSSVTYSWLINTNLNIYSNGGWGNDWTFYIILNYTKTTD